jgi:two-component system KDP operon response regulator KdpE
VTALQVLLVEDEPLNRALVRAVLARADGLDFRLHEADTIERARALLEREVVDVMLLDIRLPDGSGLDLGREVRDRRTSEPDAEGLPLVAILSASVLPGDREDAERMGADAFIGKPFAPTDLVRLLQEFSQLIAARRGGVDDADRGR